MMKCLYASARSASVLLGETGDYELPRPVSLRLNGRDMGRESRSVRSFYGLWPDTEYTLACAAENGETEELTFRTGPETHSLNVRRFGAAGDGDHDDTAALQAAILCCPAGGRVLIPAGNYKTGPLFLKSHVTVEWQEGAVFSLLTDRSRFPILPGVTYATAEGGPDYLLGSWEGNPLDSFASALTGIGVEDVHLIGPGVIDGRAPQGDWWQNHKIKKGAYRGRLLYLRDCKNIFVPPGTCTPPSARTWASTASTWRPPPSAPTPTASTPKAAPT